MRPAQIEDTDSQHEYLRQAIRAPFLLERLMVVAMLCRAVRGRWSSNVNPPRAGNYLISDDVAVFGRILIGIYAISRKLANALAPGGNKPEKVLLAVAPRANDCRAL
jgi:hypothetical protein